MRPVGLGRILVVARQETFCQWQLFPEVILKPCKINGTTCRNYWIHCEFFKCFIFMLHSPFIPFYHICIHSLKVSNRCTSHRPPITSLILLELLRNLTAALPAAAHRRLAIGCWTAAEVVSGRDLWPPRPTLRNGTLFRRGRSIKVFDPLTLWWLLEISGKRGTDRVRDTEGLRKRVASVAGGVGTASSGHSSSGLRDSVGDSKSGTKGSTGVWPIPVSLVSFIVNLLAPTLY